MSGYAIILVTFMIAVPILHFAHKFDLGYARRLIYLSVITALLLIAVRTMGPENTSATIRVEHIVPFMKPYALILLVCGIVKGIRDWRRAASGKEYRDQFEIRTK